MPPVPIIEISKLQKHFGAVEVLKKVDIDILEGEIFGILGTNGSGKSTMINILTNQITADGGAIEIGGMPASTETNRMILRHKISRYIHICPYGKT